MANLPPKKEAPKPAPPPYSSDAPLLEQVREAMRKGIDPQAAVALAKSLPDKPERADAAFILLEYAAETGHAEAALMVARYFDPTYSQDSGTIIKDPAAAFEWYQAALSGGQQQAENHLSGLKQWVENEAMQGSVTARELLNNWQ
jgi:TPR repeat protein